MLRCLIAVVCSLWATSSFGQSPPNLIFPGSTAEIVCGSKSEEVVLHATTSATLPVVDVLSCGARLTVVAKQTDWYRVRTQDGKEGYVKGVFLAAKSSVEQATAHTKDGYIVCDLGVSGLWLLESPNGFGTHTKMHCGEKIDVLEEIPDKDAYKIETSGGNVGYAWRGSVSWNPPPWAQAQGAAAVQAVGQTKDGYIDCSSDAAGVHLYESVKGLRAIMMVHCGEKIAVLEEIQRETGNWDKIETSGGSVGYLWSGFVSWSPPTAQTQGAAIAREIQKANAAVSYSTSEVEYATQAKKQLRDMMVDPTSFTVLQVTSFVQYDKHGRATFSGCVRYLGSNVYGGKVQRWNQYQVGSRGVVVDTTHDWSWSASHYSECYLPYKAVQTDVTAEVKKALSQGDGR